MEFEYSPGWSVAKPVGGHETFFPVYRIVEPKARLIGGQNGVDKSNHGMASTLTHLLVHVVFSTKGRLNLIDDGFSDKLHAYMGGIARSNGGIALQVGGTSNHVHMLMKLKGSTSTADMVRLVKAGSSKWMNEQLENRIRFGWQSGYGAFSVSESSQNIVQRYIQNQRQHHDGQSFDDEYTFLLNRYL